MPTAPPEAALVGCYPREDVTAPKDATWSGVAHVYTPDATLFTTVTLGEPSAKALPLDRFPVDAIFTVHLDGSDGSTAHRGTFRFRVTGDENDVARRTVGPGLIAGRGRWGRRSYSGFEFGVTILGASALDD